MLKRQELKRLYNTSEFKENYIDTERKQGAVCTGEGTSFLLWSPLSEKAELRFYKEGEGGSSFFQTEMKKEKKGMWSYKTEENLHGVYYDFRTVTKGEEAVFGDPYARACGVKRNGPERLGGRQKSPKTGRDRDL